MTLAEGLRDVLLGQLDEKTTVIAEIPMPCRDTYTRYMPRESAFEIHVQNLTLDAHGVTVSVDRYTKRRLSKQKRYETLERLLDLIAEEVAKAKKAASE